MPRGRRINSSGEKSKKLLLEKAIELFSENGYHQTKISDIVKAANLTQPTFYLYFENKESLYKDLILQFQNRFSETINVLKIGNREEDFFDYLQNCFTNMFEFFAQNPGLTKIGFYQSEESEALKIDFSQILVEHLNRLNNRFLFSDLDICILAYSIVGAIERLTLSLLFTKEKDPEQLASEIINIYFSIEKVH